MSPTIAIAVAIALVISAVLAAVLSSGRFKRCLEGQMERKVGKYLAGEMRGVEKAFFVWYVRRHADFHYRLHFLELSLTLVTARPETETLPSA
jgi:hypothetical protein